MTIWLKQSTAVDVVIGPFVDDTDGKTPETALTISQADCQLTKNGAAVAQKNDATSATHLGGGHYKVPLNATDTGTLGRLRLYVNESGALPAWIDLMVLPANVYDSLIGGSDKLQTDAVEVSGDATAADNWEAILDGTRAKLYLTQLNIAATGSDPAIHAVGSGSAAGAYFKGGLTGHGMQASAGDGTYPLDRLHGIYAEGTNDGAGMSLYGGSESGSGLEVDGSIGIAAYGRDGNPGLSASNNGTAPAIKDNDTGIEDLVWDAATAGHAGAGTTGAAVAAGGGGGGGSITAIDGSTAAAQNLRKWFDGTGYAAAASSVGSVTNPVLANVTQLNGSAGDAVKLASLAQGVVTGAAIAGTLTTTEMTTSLTETTDNHWKPPAVVKWRTGALAGQARAVTGYVGATKKLQYQQTTEAPAAGDLFVIL